MSDIAPRVDAASLGLAPASAMSLADSGATQRLIAARLERLPITRTHVRARLILGMATFFDGFDSLAIGLVMPVLAAAWQLSLAETGYLISGGFFGQFLGAMLFPYLAEKLGRLRAAIYSVWVFGLASLACAASWGFASLLLGRLVQGIGLGGEVPVASTYINEIARARTRGRFFLLYEIAFAIGYLAAALTAVLLIQPFGWQSLFLIGALPALIAAIMRRTLPESPRWLAAHGRGAEADAIVAQMEREAPAPLPAPVVSQVPEPAAQATRLGELLDADYRRRSFVVWSIWFCNFFVTQALNGWMPSIYRRMLHLSVQQSLELTLLGHCISITSVIAVALLIDKVGRRLWIGGALLCGSLALTPLLLFGADDPIRMLVCASAAAFCLSSVSVSVYVYTAELYPTRIRALGCGVSATSRNIATTLSPTVIGFMLAEAGLPGTFLLLACVPIIAAIAVLGFGIETKGRVLEEISR